MFSRVIIVMTNSTSSTDCEPCPTNEISAPVSQPMYIFMPGGQFKYNPMILGPFVLCCLAIRSSTKHGANILQTDVMRASQKHYICNIVWHANTRAEQISDTVYFKHKYTYNSTLTLQKTKLSNQ